MGDNCASVISFTLFLQPQRNNESGIRHNCSNNFCTPQQRQDQREFQKSLGLTTSCTDRENGAETSELPEAVGFLGKSQASILHLSALTHHVTSVPSPKLWGTEDQLAPDGNKHYRTP